jgi:hypothetical protein
LKKKNKNKEDDDDIIDLTHLTNATSKQTDYIRRSDSLGQNDNPSELIFETIAEDRGTVSRFSDNIIFDSSRGDGYAKHDLKELQKKE